MKITVVGQGYVGLPLAIAAVNSGFTVFGLDVDEDKISRLRAGKSLVEDIGDQIIKESLDSQRYIPTTDPNFIEQSDVTLICVPTPLTDDNKPDLSMLLAATTTVGKKLKAGSLVIVESTIEPGTSRNLVLPILIKESGLSGSEFDLAYSPERIDPTNKIWNISNTPKLVAGFSDGATKKTEEFYRKFVDSITICASCLLYTSPSPRD